MKISERTLRISASSFLALLMIGASYLLSGPNSILSKTANAESTEELLKAYAAKDTDNDGLPDWQETLYGTDPNKAISNQFGISDGEAAKQGKLTPNSLASQLPSDDESGTTTTQDLLNDIPGVDPAPGSITEQFSHEFLQEVVEASNNQTLDDASKEAIQSKLFTEYSAKAASLFVSRYTNVSVHVNSGTSITAYTQNLETILKNNEVAEGEGDPILLMDSLINKNDESARPKIVQLAKAFGTIRDQLLSTPVPPSLVNQHVQLIRSFDSLSKATTAVTTYEKDPMGMLGGLSAYQPADAGVLDALRGISSAILSTGEPAPGAPGAYILNAVRSAEKI